MVFLWFSYGFPMGSKWIQSQLAVSPRVLRLGNTSLGGPRGGATLGPAAWRFVVVAVVGFMGDYGEMKKVGE